MYQKKQEYYQANANRTLKRMLGRNNFIVNISIQYAEIQREVQSIKYTPQEIREQYTQSTTKKKQNDFAQDSSREQEANKQLKGQDKNTYSLYRQPSIVENKELVVVEAQSRPELEKLPGLIPEKRSGYGEELPGFPRVSPYSIEAKIQEAVNKQKENNSGAINYEPDQDSTESLDTTEEDHKNSQSKTLKKQFTIGSEEKEDQLIVKQIMDENKETITIPDSKIDRMYISLVINSDKLNELDLSKEEVSNVLKTVVGYYPLRGDEIYSVDYPFKGFAYEVRKNLSVVSAFFKDNILIIILIISIPLLIFALFKLIKLIIYLRSASAKRKVEDQESEQQKQAEESQSKIDKQQDELIDLAKGKPDDFAKALVDWIEKVDLI